MRFMAAGPAAATTAPKESVDWPGQEDRQPARQEGDRRSEQDHYQGAAMGLPCPFVLRPASLLANRSS